MNSCIICSSIISRKRKLCDNPSCKSELSRRTIAASFQRHGGEITKFRKTNGMHDPKVRQLVSDRLKEIGHAPSIRGGNGTGPTIPESILSSALGWKTNVIVNTHGGRASGYPTHYKLDIGNEDIKVGIEVDGNSHCALSRKAQDKKKVDWLSRNGWRIFRFTNHQVLTDLELCLSTIREAI